MAITQMDQVTQQNAALVNQSASAAQSLQEQAEQLSRAISVFKVNDAQYHGQALA
jgi:methyl-accepting chemotaxis protein